MSAFLLKITALISMLCDHSSYVIFGGFSFLNYIGRIAFPIFAFQISEGYIHTSNLKKYFFRLLIFAFISQAPFMLFLSDYSNDVGLNIFFTLSLGLSAIIIYDKLNKMPTKNKALHYLYKFLAIVSFILLCVLSEFSHCDYGYFGVLIIFIFYIFKNNKFLMNSAFILSTIVYQFNNLYRSLSIPYLFYTYLFIVIFTISSLVFINAYNNEKGKDTKYFLYLFYPIHLLVLYFISIL